MSRMIPARMDPDSPASERRIFELLRTDPDTTGWIVLHSLGLIRREHKPYGEIDFVVLIPGAGIVCLEVKGGRIRCENGIWYTRDRYDHEHALSRSPIMQAREGMFALRDALRRHFGTASVEANTLITSAVVLPDVGAPPVGIEAERWQYIDCHLLKARPISRIIQTLMRHARELLGRSTPGPEPSVIQCIRAFLRPDFDIVVARSTTIQRAEEQLVRLTEEQFDILDSIELNERCVVDGAAGTGKTMIALELARRSLADGRRPIVLCFNRILGRWIERELGMEFSFAGSYYRILRSLITGSSVRAEFEADSRMRGNHPDFSEWSAYAQEALSERGTIGDLLVVDETQDLATDANFRVFDAMIEKGLSDGRWVFFGDFTRQAIFGGACSEEGFAGFEKLLRKHAPFFTALRLNVNCRNTRQIAEETAMIAGFEHLPYRLNAAEGPAVDFRYWDTEEEEIEELDRAIGDLLRDGVRTGDITILSPVRFMNSVASRLPERGRDVVDIAGTDLDATDNAIRFSTIHSFKGMETPTGILVDLKGIDDAARQSLLYVGMSRVRTYLVMLVHQTIKAHVQAAVMRRIRSGD